MEKSTRIITLNLKKGAYAHGFGCSLEEAKSALAHLSGEGECVLFLQETYGLCSGRRGRWGAQHEFLASPKMIHGVYGLNAINKQGHYGNAVISTAPLSKIKNKNISAAQWEKRGVLHGWCHGQADFEFFCVHLGLRRPWRRAQMESLGGLLGSVAHSTDAGGLAERGIIAGDFNDWPNDAGSLLRHWGFEEAHAQIAGKPGKTFPAPFPILRLDRIYVRGGRVTNAFVPKGGIWRKLSDHLPVVADIRWNE